jgi:hypothetical protein
MALAASSRTIHQTRDEARLDVLDAFGRLRADAVEAESPVSLLTKGEVVLLLVALIFPSLAEEALPVSPLANSP